MKLLIFTIIIFLYTVINIKFCKLIHNEKYIKNKKVSDIILAILCLTLIFLYIWTLKVDRLSFVKFNYMDSYAGIDTLYGIMKISIYIMFNISLAIFLSNLLYQIFDKNKVLYYISVFVIIILLFVYNNATGVISVIYSNRVSIFGNTVNVLYMFFFLITIFLSLLYDNISSNKKNVDEKKENIKNAILVVLYLIICIISFNRVTSFYPTYLYEKVFEKVTVKKENNKTVLMKDVKYDDMLIGDTIQFGVRYEGYSTYCPIEWIVIDKDDKNKKLLLLSKNGIDVEQNDAIRQSIDIYDSYSSYYNEYYDYDESDLKAVNYNNSALRFEFNECYRYFVNNCLSKEANEEYNEYRFKDNIDYTYLEDTKTKEKFFPLSEAEYNKYKKIPGVGNFYFINSTNYVVYRREFNSFYVVLRDLREIGEGIYDFKCLSPKYTISEYEWDKSNGFPIRDNDNTILKPFWFSTANEDSDDLWHNFVDVVLRPAMWYECEE